MNGFIRHNRQILETGILTPVSITGNNYTSGTLTLSHTYKTTECIINIAPISYVDCAYITATAHWGAKGVNAYALLETNQISIYVTNLYSGAQTCGCYYEIVGPASAILD